jgi:hypothetical protein
MISRFVKNIRVFFLLLAGLALNAHMIIPHDHHLAESVAGSENDCPVSDGETSHHTGFPVHCHAFNDLTSEKVRSNHITTYIKYSFLIISSLSDATAKELHFSCRSISDFREPFPDSFLLEYSSLRAPPSLI